MLGIGRIIGGLLGYVATKTLLGMFLGVMLGTYLENLIRSRQVNALPDRFLTTIFLIMGHIAKADGRVSDYEIRQAKAIMQRLNLKSAQIETAISHFNQGKSAYFDLDACLSDFVECYRYQPLLLQLFLEIQYEAAQSPRGFHRSKIGILEKIANRFGLPPPFVFDEGPQHAHSHQRTRTERSPSELDKAYQILGVKPGTPFAEVKSAYRRLISLHHPDKLIAKGLPEDKIRAATEKAQQIQKAYDTLAALPR
jgi:DnaJ like chaperone protein